MSLLTLCSLCGSIFAGQAHINQRVRSGRSRVVAVPVYDIEVSDHKGRKLRFYTDLLKDKVFVLSFFYTSCDYLCPMQEKGLKSLQEKLGSRLGTEVLLISVTTDPVTDTRERLREWAAQHGVRPGWLLITGSPNELVKALVPLTGDGVGRREMHTQPVYIGKGSTGNWVVTDGLSDADYLMKLIEDIAK